MPQERQEVIKTTYSLRSAVTELIHWMQIWSKRDESYQATEEGICAFLRALVLISLDGVANSGVPRGTSSKVLLLMRELAHDRMDAFMALEKMEVWEHGQAD